jgi:hypothetical protein
VRALAVHVQHIGRQRALVQALRRTCRSGRGNRLAELRCCAAARTGASDARNHNSNTRDARLAAQATLPPKQRPKCGSQKKSGENCALPNRPPSMPHHILVDSQPSATCLKVVGGRPKELRAPSEGTGPTPELWDLVASNEPAKRSEQACGYRPGQPARSGMRLA